MKIHNHLFHLRECLTRWDVCPNEKLFIQDYATPLSATTLGFFEGYHDVLTDLDWDAYRTHALTIDPEAEEARLVKNIALVEDLFGFKLEGEVFLLGTFQYMDGFARFDRGRHQVFLGVDEDHLNGRYLDVLTTHELTHVARESRPEVWEGWGLNPKMPRADFLEYQPVIEHLVGEGFSCAVSELLVPGEAPWRYAYQNEQSLKLVQKHAKEMDRIIHQEIKNPNGDYGSLYGIRPNFAHYVWAWQWVKQVLKTHADHDPRKLVTLCSKELVQSALEFQLSKIDLSVTN